MFLVDTNIWLELLLEQEKSDEVRAFLEYVDSSQLALTDFALHSIGLILTRLKRDSLFQQFLSDVIDDSSVSVIRLSVDELQTVITVLQDFSLDFDDAYQYVSAKAHDLTLVSFDTDFDRTERGRKLPSEAVTMMNNTDEINQED